MNRSSANTISFVIFIGISLFLSIACHSENDQQQTVTADLPIEGEKEKEKNEDACEGKNSSVNHLGTLPTRTEIDSWELVWEDDFKYHNEDLDKLWASQNGSSGHILSSRWRDNAVVKNGVLELQAKKENRGGQEWTTGNIWTKQTFGYGYYECKYKYAGASGTNNSFWLFPRDKSVAGDELICELDINEGHFPNEVNTNRHHWQNGSSENNQLAYAKGLSPAYAHTFKNSVTTNRIRFSSKNANHFHIKEFRVYEFNNNCNYSEDFLANDSEENVNLIKESKMTFSGVLEHRFKIESIADGLISTSWVSQKEGEKWIEFLWDVPQNIGHIQFVNGWQNQGKWTGLMTDYKIEAYVDGAWQELTHYDIKENYNYAEQYNVYGMEWAADVLKFYMDDKLIRTIPNTLCDKELNIFLSLAILDHGGEVTDAIDGTSMKIDWVKYYKKR